MVRERGSGLRPSLINAICSSEVKDGDNDIRRLRDEVLQLVRTSAEAEGRVVSWTCDPFGHRPDETFSGPLCTMCLASKEKT